MASHPPAKCCTIGVKHNGEPTGTSFHLRDTEVCVFGKDGGSFKRADIEFYVAEPSGDKIHKDTAILYLPDVIGIWQNSKLMVDQFAANGYYTLMPDIFNGDPLEINRPKDFDLMAWVEHGSTGNNPHTFPEVDAIVQKSIDFLREKGYKKIGAVGYCFGAKSVVRFMERLMGKGKGLGINVGYLAHPSFVEEHELLSINGPLSIAAAENDAIFTVEKRHKSEELLIKTKQPYQISLYGGVSHGFAVRGDPSNKVQRYAKEQAFLQAVAWFDEHLLNSEYTE